PDPFLRRTKMLVFAIQASKIKATLTSTAADRPSVSQFQLVDPSKREHFAHLSAIILSPYNSVVPFHGNDVYVTFLKHDLKLDLEELNPELFKARKSRFILFLLHPTTRKCLQVLDATPWFVEVYQQTHSGMVCFQCGATPAKLKSCGKCGAKYCSIEHQTEDWPYHRPFCMNHDTKPTTPFPV